VASLNENQYELGPYDV